MDQASYGHACDLLVHDVQHVNGYAQNARRTRTISGLARVLATQPDHGDDVGRWWSSATPLAKRSDEVLRLARGDPCVPDLSNDSLDPHRADYSRREKILRWSSTCCHLRQRLFLLHWYQNSDNEVEDDLVKRK